MKYIFHGKIQLLVTAMTRTWMDPHWFGSLDPDQHILNKKLD
jgi:hypothetical protein